MPTLEQLREMLQAQANPSTQPTTHQEPEKQPLADLLFADWPNVLRIGLTAPGKAKALKGYVVRLVGNAGAGWRVVTAHGPANTIGEMTLWTDRSNRESDMIGDFTEALKAVAHIVAAKEARGYSFVFYESDEAEGTPESIRHLHRMVEEAS